jgi:hypothetical protein
MTNDELSRAFIFGKLTTLTNIFDVSVMGETDPPSCYL